ncbi:helix-turn-helix domain-containing protein [Streptococcus parauberis]|uniref:helix-turn-helix domain-containing protein n=1 Tax=Streptococcus parauberis TaxID=1348 RepID=UPI0002BBBF43|nr:helix-turn-helix domain-containing protein [Streptococcus parauberis]EMF49131.1 transcriptional regulator, Cro/CI family [Streptococcus parauberis KRS-02109]UWM87088.1 helix-turn-helix domain-containing protein [Streptococcus parauberis]UWM89062.1 helix-turn-helix domain-containing protein [Streptococcus parauberis]WEM59800.1 helix-turn-helix domain-containing protein [Streptococcus parauberis]
MVNNSIFPQRLKKLRKEKGLTQKELGERLGVKQNTFTNWENGKREPNLSTILKLAEILETTTDDLLGYTILSANQPVVSLSEIDVANIDKLSMTELGMLKVAIVMEVAKTSRNTKEIIQELIEVYHLNETQTELLNDIVIEVKNAFVDDI